MFKVKVYRGGKWVNAGSYSSYGAAMDQYRKLKAMGQMVIVQEPGGTRALAWT